MRRNSLRVSFCGGMADVEQTEEVETDSTVDQQVDIVEEEEETTSIVEEDVETTWDGMTGTRQVPVPFSSSSGVEDELENG